MYVERPLLVKFDEQSESLMFLMISSIRDFQTEYRTREVAAQDAFVSFANKNLELLEAILVKPV